MTTGFYFETAFATSGDQSSIPLSGTETGTINFLYGYGSNYSASLKTDPDAITVDRLTFNYLNYNLTLNWQALYQAGVVPFITSAMNSGSPHAYAVNAICRYTDGHIYFNTVASNTSSPPGNGWISAEPKTPVTITGSPGTSAVNTVVVSNGGGLMTIPLPSVATTNEGDTFQVVGVGAGGWKISQAALQEIFFGNTHTTIGIGGYLASTDAGDGITLRYCTAAGGYVVTSSIGNITVV